MFLLKASSCFSLLHSSDYRCLPPHSASSFKWCFHCTYKHIYIYIIHTCILCILAKLFFIPFVALPVRHFATCLSLPFNNYFWTLCSVSLGHFTQDLNLVLFLLFLTDSPTLYFLRICFHQHNENSQT